MARSSEAKEAAVVTGKIRTMGQILYADLAHINFIRGATAPDYPDCPHVVSMA